MQLEYDVRQWTRDTKPSDRHTLYRTHVDMGER